MPWSAPWVSESSSGLRRAGQSVEAAPSHSGPGHSLSPNHAEVQEAATNFGLMVQYNLIDPVATIDDVQRRQHQGGSSQNLLRQF